MKADPVGSLARVNRVFARVSQQAVARVEAGMKTTQHQERGDIAEALEAAKPDVFRALIPIRAVLERHGFEIPGGVLHLEVGSSDLDHAAAKECVRTCVRVCDDQGCIVICYWDCR